jgi:quinol monooxygenase YgiN
MHISPDKHRELTQTLMSLIESIRTEQGCRRCDLWQNVEDENRLCLLEEWASQADLKKHMKSRSFRVLRGAMSLLKEQHEISFSTLFDPDER